MLFNSAIKYVLLIIGSGKRQNDTIHTYMLFYFFIWRPLYKIDVSHQLKTIFLNVAAKKIDENRLKTTHERKKLNEYNKVVGKEMLLIEQLRQ